jgi:predicted PurR-regulated permease PerM
VNPTVNKSRHHRVFVDLEQAIVVSTIIVSIAAAFVVAYEVFAVLFLGALFGVFLTKLSRRISDKLPLGYLVSLTFVVIALLVLVAGASTLFFVQINEQVEKMSVKVDEGMGALRKSIDKYPVLKAAATATPFLTTAHEAETKESEEDSDPSKGEGEKDQDNEKDQNKSDAPSPVQSDSVSKPTTKTLVAVGRVFTTTFGLVVNCILIFFVGLFLAISPTSYRDGVVRLVPQTKRKRITEVLDATADNLWQWLLARFGSMLATGGGAFLLLLALGVPMAGTLGILTALLTFIPNIGAGIALLLAVVSALPQGTGTVVAVVGGYMIVQLLESYVVTPLIEQKAVSLPPALVIAFQAVMSVLFGFIGATVASPALAAGKTIIEKLYIEDQLESNELS